MPDPEPPPDIESDADDEDFDPDFNPRAGQNEPETETEPESEDEPEENQWKQTSTTKSLRCELTMWVTNFDSHLSVHSEYYPFGVLSWFISQHTF